MLRDPRWQELDELLAVIRSDAVADDAMPESLALIFHGGRLSAILATPPFVFEQADIVTDEFCRFLPTTMADQLGVVWPARYEDGDEVMYAMKVHLWERSRPDRVVTRIIPVPIHGAPNGASVEIELLVDPDGPMAAAVPLHLDN